MSKVNRDDQVKAVWGKTLVPDAYKHFREGARWADKNPYWKTSIPLEHKYVSGELPKLFLCKCISLDMTWGWRYTYRIGFVTADGKWNIDAAGGMIRVVAYMDIISDESEAALMEDIKKYEDSFAELAAAAINKSKEQ